MKIGKRVLCWLLLSVFIGSMCACSNVGEDNSDRDQMGMEEEIEENDRGSDPANTPEEHSDDSAGMEDESAESSEANMAEEPSDDREELKRLSKEFAEIYFNRDVDKIPGYLTVPYEWDHKEVYPHDGAAPDYTIKGLDTVEETDIGSVKTVWAEFKSSEQDDYFQYLRMEFIKQEDGWKIKFYGLEI